MSFYGDVLKTDLVAGIALTETAYSSKLKLPKHSHTYPYFCFVLRGSYTEAHGKHSRVCTRSTLIFHPSEEEHTDYFYSDTCCFNIQLTDQWLKRVQQYLRLLDSPADFRGGRLAHLATRIYKEFRWIDDLSPLVIEALALEIIVESFRQAVGGTVHKPPPWLEQARELLNERFSQNLTLAYISESVGVHPVHLAREFRRFYQCTIGEYIRQRRVDLACHKIATSNLPTSEIALSLGFFDQSHFARTFKAITGLTPNQYRTAFRSR